MTNAVRAIRKAGTSAALAAAGIGIALLGCGEQREEPAAPAVTSTAAAASHGYPCAAGKFRFAEPPVVVYTGVPAPDYEFRAYVRLNRPLPRRPHASLSIDDQTDLPGPVRAHTSRPCYYAGVGITDTAPESFLNPKDGQLMTVSFDARGIGKPLEAKVPAKLVDGNEYENERAQRRLLRRLGCVR